MKDPHVLLDKLIKDIDKLEGDVGSLYKENKEIKDILKKLYDHNHKMRKQHDDYEKRIKNCETYHKC